MNNINIKNTLDEIPKAKSNAKSIVGLVKDSGRVIGYKLSDNRKVSKEEAISMAREGMIYGVGIARNGDTEYLKSIPNSKESDNLGNLPSVTE